MGNRKEIPPAPTPARTLLLVLPLVLILTLGLPLPAWARTPPLHYVHVQVVEAPLLRAGEEARVVIALSRSRDRAPLTPSELEDMHESKLHLLLIDAALSDYQHIHPTEGDAPGRYAFRFTPHSDGGYRVWVDVKPVAAKREEYIAVDLPAAADTPAPRAIDTTASEATEAGGLAFTLRFDQRPRAGEMTMGQVTVTKDGAPFTLLEPVMGAYAHIVAFPADRASVLHAHPLGEAPASADARGGPALAFHFMPAQSGFAKLFVQVRVNGRDIFAPFGVLVK